MLEKWLSPEQILELDELAINHKISVHPLCNKIRMERIERLIKDTNMSYEQIAKKFNMTSRSLRNIRKAFAKNERNVRQQ